MNQITQPLTPASTAEISEMLRVLFDALPFQRGANGDNVATAYIEAVRGASAESIEAGIRKFLRGECGDVSPRYVPTPPELARIVRTTVVRSLMPEPRRLAPPAPAAEGERARMRLKMPMYRFAYATGQMDALAAANREGMGAMIVLASKWGVDIPQELLAMDEAQAERDWRTARNRAWAQIEANPPPFMRHRGVRRELERAA